MSFLQSLFGGNQQHAINAKNAFELLQGQEPPFVLDVREPYEFATGHIKGAKLIPLDELSERMNEIPKDRKIICVCQSGARSGAATRHRVAAGYDVLNLNSGMLGWMMAGLKVSK